MAKSRGDCSGADLTFAPPWPRTPDANVKSKLHLRLIFASDPLILTFAKSACQTGVQMLESDHQRHDASASAVSSGTSSANPASVVRLGSETPSTLNISPMPPRPPPTSRFNALATSSE